MIIALLLLLLLLLSYLFNTAQITILRHFTIVSGHPIRRHPQQPGGTGAVETSQCHVHRWLHGSRESLWDAGCSASPVASAVAVRGKWWREFGVWKNRKLWGTKIWRWFWIFDSPLPWLSGEHHGSSDGTQVQLPRRPAISPWSTSLKFLWRRESRVHRQKNEEVDVVGMPVLQQK